MKMKFLKCKGCGKIVLEIKGSSCPTKCCGEPMEEMIPGMTEGAGEKHIPDCDLDGNTLRVQVGSVLHPMLEEHHIEWVAVQTKEGFQLKELQPGKEPKADFILTEDDEVEAVYENCNLHGFWKAV